MVQLLSGKDERAVSSSCSSHPIELSLLSGRNVKAVFLVDYLPDNALTSGDTNVAYRHCTSKPYGSFRRVMNFALSEISLIN